MTEHPLKRMEFAGFKGYKRMYRCDTCGQKFGLERSSNGKIPYCFGVLNRIVFRSRAEYLAEGRARDPKFCTHGSTRLESA